MITALVIAAILSWALYCHMCKGPKPMYSGYKFSANPVPGWLFNG